MKQTHIIKNILDNKDLKVKAVATNNGFICKAYNLENNLVTQAKDINLHKALMSIVSDSELIK